MRLTIRAVACAAMLALAAFAAVAPAADAPPAAVDPGVKTWQVFAALGYLIVLAGLGFAVVRFAKRGGAWRAAAGADGPVRVLSSTRVAPGVTLTLLDVEGRRVLVAATASGTSVVELSAGASP